MSETDLIAQLEREYDRRQIAEKALQECVGICESYFKYGSRTEINNNRYGSIIEIVKEYFDKLKKEDDQDDDTKLQPKHG